MLYNDLIADMDIEIEIAIIGAGVVGLAIAAELARSGKSIFVFERNSSYGQETSSRNSEVIHTGIYYPEDFLKTKLCVEGNRLLYELCQKHNIPHKKTGKIIFAVTEDEIPKLEQIYEQASRNGVTDLEILSRTDIKGLEPSIECRAGILSPSTGIIDSHSLMNHFHKQAIQNSAELLFETQVVGLDRAGDGWRVSIRERDGVSELLARIVINCAGLHADKVARLAGIDRSDYKLHYCKGEYFSLCSKWRNAINHLVYPTPKSAGLGVHATLSLDGMIRLGPSARYTDEIEYAVDNLQKDIFYQSAKKFLPQLEIDDLQPDCAGIRPKLHGPADAFRDFVIVHEEQEGYEGLINLIGIESPGLTASPAIAKYVANMVAIR